MYWLAFALGAAVATCGCVSAYLLRLKPRIEENLLQRQDMARQRRIADTRRVSVAQPGAGHSRTSRAAFSTRTSNVKNRHTEL